MPLAEAQRIVNELRTAGERGLTPEELEALGVLVGYVRDMRAVNLARRTRDNETTNTYRDHINSLGEDVERWKKRALEAEAKLVTRGN